VTTYYMTCSFPQRSRYIKNEDACLRILGQSITFFETSQLLRKPRRRFTGGSTQTTLMQGTYLACIGYLLTDPPIHRLKCYLVTNVNSSHRSNAVKKKSGAPPEGDLTGLCPRRSVVIIRKETRKEKIRERRG